MNPARKLGFTLKSALLTQSDIGAQPRKGFTLIELLIVIAIVGILAALVLLAINPARRVAQARDSGRRSDIGQLATAAQAFFTTNGRYPTALAELVTSQDLKQVPTPPAGGTCSGFTVYGLTLNAATSEMGIYSCLEAPTTATAATVYQWLSRTGNAQEYTAIQAP